MRIESKLILSPTTEQELELRNKVRIDRKCGTTESTANNNPLNFEHRIERTQTHKNSQTLYTVK